MAGAGDLDGDRGKKMKCSSEGRKEKKIGKEGCGREEGRKKIISLGFKIWEK